MSSSEIPKVRLPRLQPCQRVGSPRPRQQDERRGAGDTSALLKKYRTNGSVGDVMTRTMCSKVIVPGSVGRSENASGVGVTAVRITQKNGNKAMTIARPSVVHAAAPLNALANVLHLADVLPDVQAAHQQDEDEHEHRRGGGVAEIADEGDVVGGDRDHVVALAGPRASRSTGS